MRPTFRMLVFTWSVLLALVAWAGGCSSSSSPSPTLSSIAVTPTAASIEEGKTQQLEATGTYSDASTKKLTSLVTWKSSATSVATVDAHGLATGVSAGSATISASIVDNGVMVLGTTTLAVTTSTVPASIAVTPKNASIAMGTAEQLTATGTYHDGSTKDLTTSVTWSSSDATVIALGGPGSMGLATAVGVGTATVTAKLGAVSGSTTATVTNATLQAIQVSSPDAYLAKGLTEQFTATGIFSDDTWQDLTHQVTWASSGPAVTISGGGLAVAASEGLVYVSATKMGVTGARSFGVTSATLATLAVTPYGPTIAKGTQVSLAATGVLTDDTVVDLTANAVWTSSDTSVANLSTDATAKGVVRGVGAGSSVVTAAYSGKSASTTVTVTGAMVQKLSLVPLNPTMPKGTTLAFSAIATFTDGSAQDLTPLASWGSSNPQVAVVSNASWSHGLARAVQQGTTTITAAFAGKSDTTTLTISPAVLSAIAVTPSFPMIAKGTSIQMTATATFSDGTAYDLTPWVTWSSSDPSVSMVNAAGLPGVATGVSMGSSVVGAKLMGVTGSTTVTVTQAQLSSVAVTPTNPSIPKGKSLWMQATGTFTDQTTMDLTNWVAWSSSDASVLVSNAMDTHGLATGRVVGQATVTATFLGGVKGSTTVTVTSATLVSLAVTPQHPSIAKGTGFWLDLTGTYSDNSTQDLTDQAAWESSDPSVGLSYGKYLTPFAYGAAVGQSTITASFGGESATTLVTVTAATLSSLEMSLPTATMAKGTAASFAVTGHYSDASTQDLTYLATWSSSDASVALVSNAAGSHGLVTAVAPGSATITAEFGGDTATMQLTVTAATLASIAVLPQSPTAHVNGTVQLSARGTYTDNSQQDITALVTWSSGDESLALVSNAAGSRGLVTGVAAGSTTITAQYAEIVGTVPITISP